MNVVPYDECIIWSFCYVKMRIWKKQEETPWKRKLHYVPQKYSSLRQVPAYPKFIKERFTRCMDLYLCPRARKMRVSINVHILLLNLNFN